MPLLDTLLGLIAPHACLGCEREGSLLCAWCQVEYLLPMPTPTLSTLALDHIWIRTEYAGVARQLLRRFKFDRARAAGHTIAGMMDEALPFLPRQTIIIPVPTATSRVRSRGYDHAALLARLVAKQQNLLFYRALARLTQTRQVGATRAQRLTQLARAFEVTQKFTKGSHFLLVDDVLTTGATLNEAAQTLRRAGANSVSALVFAYKQIDSKN